MDQEQETEDLTTLRSQSKLEGSPGLSVHVY